MKQQSLHQYLHQNYKNYSVVFHSQNLNTGIDCVEVIETFVESISLINTVYYTKSGYTRFCPCQFGIMSEKLVAFTVQVQYLNLVISSCV